MIKAVKESVSRMQEIVEKEGKKVRIRGIDSRKNLKILQKLPSTKKSLSW
jgi:hypothetical protein